jgi:hypothetical protein
MDAFINVRPCHIGLTNDFQDEAMDSPSDEAIPQHKSAVYVDPFAARVSRPSLGLSQTNANSLLTLDQGGNRFQKGDTVHMSIVENGARRKGIFTVRKARYNDKSGIWEYQLSDGAWARENTLKLERARE